MNLYKILEPLKSTAPTVYCTVNSIQWLTHGIYTVQVCVYTVYTVGLGGPIYCAWLVRECASVLLPGARQLTACVCTVLPVWSPIVYTAAQMTAWGGGGDASGWFGTFGIAGRDQGLAGQ